MSDSVGRRARNKQDKAHPMLINVDDARLVPNVPRLRALANYRIFMGDPRASLEERKRILEMQGIKATRAVVDSSAPSAQSEDEAPFDIGKATREELRAFAFDTYGAVIDQTGDTHLMTVRAQVRALAKEARDLSGG